MKKNILIFGVIIIAGLCLLGGCNGEKSDTTSAEKTAKQAIQALLENDVPKYFSLCTDEFIESEIKQFGVPTQKMLVNEYEKFFGGYQETLKNQYGKKWEYTIRVIDTYEYIPNETDEEFLLYKGEELVEVACEIDFSGKRFLKKIEETEKEKVQLVRRGNKWYII